jgi:YbgC/YbaW family acyl-CoA thioester hydrolase
VSAPGAVTASLRIRHADCDVQGIVFTARWFELFTVAIGEFWRETIGGYENLPRAHAIQTVVAETGARFRGAARPDDLVDFTVSVARVGTSSLRVELEAAKDGHLLVEGFVEFVFVDSSNFAPVEIPATVRELLPEPGAAS